MHPSYSTYFILSTASTCYSTQKTILCVLVMDFRKYWIAIRNTKAEITTKKKCLKMAYRPHSFVLTRILSASNLDFWYVKLLLYRNLKKLANLREGIKGQKENQSNVCSASGIESFKINSLILWSFLKNSCRGGCYS